MGRTTKKQVEFKFKLFIEAVGGEIADQYNQVGKYQLNYNSTYGGYNIERIYNDAGGITHPFDTSRKKASEFWDCLDFAIYALNLKK